MLAGARDLPSTLGSRRRLTSSRRPDSVSESQPAALAQLPAVGRLLETARFRSLADAFGRPLVTAALRTEISELRRALRAAAVPAGFSRNPEAWLAAAVESQLERAAGPDLRRVINATGVVVHTNLGRAPLSERAAQAVFRAASGYSDLEFDLASGARGSRQEHVGGLFEAMFPGKASAVTGNAAGGVLLALDTLAAGKDVVVSRGELVEIGDSFRIPDILKKSGARLVEVGTTNRTRLDDYRRAITGSQGEVGALLKVHQSNIRIVGFTEAASTADLVALGAEFGIPVIEDFGSGNLQPLAELGVEDAGDEPTLADRVASGADLVVFSGDKLFGGPQAGILLGTPEAIRACRKNPLARALRPDKMAIAGLQATLWSHLTGRARREIPVVRAIARPLEEIAAAAARLRAALAPAGGWQVEVVAETSRIGGGAAPGASLPTRCLALSRAGSEAEAIRRRLLRNEPPVVGRIVDDRLLLDLRTVPAEEDDELLAALKSLVDEPDSRG
ncbi:MAG: L-seryl-tRNA(Sec) selenium transferase [Acidobacteria bacterium]|nr:L-seryl-tRNA(Sec) selenium transferase [Acidobacteriota bacterium]